MWGVRERKALRIMPTFLPSAIKMEKAAGADVRRRISSDLDILSLRCLSDVCSISDRSSWSLACGAFGHLVCSYCHGKPTSSTPPTMLCLRRRPHISQAGLLVLTQNGSNCALGKRAVLASHWLNLDLLSWLTSFAYPHFPGSVLPNETTAQKLLPQILGTKTETTSKRRCE